MSTRLYLAPAAAGKTTYALTQARLAAQGLRCVPRVVVPTQLQVRTCKRRLAEMGGTLGVHVGTFGALYATCLNAVGEVYTELTEPIQYRLMRSVVDSLPLQYYTPLTDRPGFIQVLCKLVGELKAARIQPQSLMQAVANLGNELRLRELAEVYSVYQRLLQSEGWADHAGIAWLALEALEERAPDVGRDWPLLIVDGFDNFTEVQLALLRVLAGRVGELVVTLTGCADSDKRPWVHERFADTAGRLADVLGTKAEALPDTPLERPHALSFLEANLYRPTPVHAVPNSGVEWIEAPDRVSEVRSALRWLKALLVGVNGAVPLRPIDVALLARDIVPYYPFVLQIAAEFGVPVRLASGLSLATNPAVAALLDLLRLSLPDAESHAQVALPRRQVIEAWRSPYLAWSAHVSENDPEGIGIELHDADALDAAARWRQVIGGLDQWQEALQALAKRSSSPESDEERALPSRIPTGAAAQQLWGKFQRFVRRITPPETAHTYREYVSWLEDMIGSDPQPGESPVVPEENSVSLCVFERARRMMQGEDTLPDLAELDIAALQMLKDILRGLVWAEQAVRSEHPVSYAQFFSDLEGAIHASVYRPALRPEHQEVLVSDVVQARGVPLRAVALLGMAEGEFPAKLNEDPFLRDADRVRLSQELGLRLAPSTASAEVEFFYETVSRPSDHLLLSRPRLADTGADWLPSPYWEEVKRWAEFKPQRMRVDAAPCVQDVASWPELMESLATHHNQDRLEAWVDQTDPERQAALQAASQMLEARRPGQGSACDGDLTTLAREFSAAFAPQRTWSASRLETYRACPFRFFVTHVLRLEPRVEPTEGLNAAQIGNIFHRILEQVYLAPEVRDQADVSQLLQALGAIARKVLDEAPVREGFRATAWWEQTRAEIEEKMRRSLIALHSPELSGDYVPVAHEVAFERANELVVHDGDDSFRLRGRIDRIDRTPDGRLRIIDYKSGGKSSFTNQALSDGKKIQLALYAVAVRDALHLGEPVDGFYWHVQQAERSSLTLSKYRGEAGESAPDVAVQRAWEAVRGVRAGAFVPLSPEDGCPPYCPALAFCWHYVPGFGG